MTAAPPDQPPGLPRSSRGRASARQGRNPERSEASARASYVARARRYDAARPTRVRKIDSAKALQLWKRGASDVTIAKACGVGRRGAKAWRDARGLPANRQQGGAAGCHKLTPTDKRILLRRLAREHPLTRVARDFGVAHAVAAWHRDRERREAEGAEGRTGNGFAGA